MSSDVRFHSLSPWERVRVRGLSAAETLTPTLSQREREKEGRR
jgi:hypothetical protein